MSSNHTCIVCKGSKEEVALISFEYKEHSYHICPQHIPILIHSPEKLKGLIPGAENFEAADS